MISSMVDFVKSESATTDLERDFKKWRDEVVKLAGCNLDEDWAFDLFMDGCEAADAALEMRRVSSQ